MDVECKSKANVANKFHMQHKKSRHLYFGVCFSFFDVFIGFSKNMKNKFITVRELDSNLALSVFCGKRRLTADDGKIVLISDYFNWDKTFMIESLKELTHYNIVIGDPEIRSSRVILNNPVRTFWESNFVISKAEHESTYKAQFEKIRNNIIPISWGANREMRAEVSDFSGTHTFYVRGNVIDKHRLMVYVMALMISMNPILQRISTYL